MNITPYQDIYPTIDATAYVAPNALVIGDVVIGKDSSVWPTAIIRGDVNYIRIGDRTNIQDASVLHVSHASEINGEGFPLIIGNDVTVGHRVTLHGCRIDDCCLIGIGSIILDGVHVQSHVVVGAGSLVTSGKVLESGYLYLGQPARKARPLTQEEMDYFKYTAAYYTQVKNNY
jgi:carbonic anhydrase/acetyltransferase-like protein (isoleucine patch superfamily)